MKKTRVLPMPKITFLYPLMITCFICSWMPEQNNLTSTVFLSVFILNLLVFVAMAKTWELHIDDPLPQDIRYPLFVRTDRTSWKLGGKISYVKDEKMLLEECELLRRAFGWNAIILAREWLEFAEAGTFRMGSLPQEVRVWIVDSQVFAWSFHHMLVVKDPEGFPLTTEDKTIIFDYASQIGKSFTSRLIVADFAKLKNGKWTFIEAGPGSCAGTGHEEIFKSVACKLLGRKYVFAGNKIGGFFTDVC